MLGRFWTSIIKPMLVALSSNDASFATSSVTIFWLLGICTNSSLSNFWVRCFVILWNFYILSSIASYSSLIYPITSFESLWTIRLSAPSAFPNLNLVSIPSYSASLLVAENFNWTSYLSISPSGAVMTTLTPSLFYVDEPSVCIVHRSISLVRLSSSGRVNSAMKSTKAYALMVVLRWYSISNWLSSIAHWTILPAASGLFMDFLMGWSVITEMGFAWKYSLNLRDATINANAIFSILGYLALAPWKAWLA